MTIPALPYPDMISQGASHSESQRVLRAQFGDGYEQTTPDGINATLAEWDVSWENMTGAERDAVVAVLRAVGNSLPMSWTPFGETTQKLFKVDDGFTETFPSGAHYTIRCSLREVK